MCNSSGEDTFAEFQSVKEKAKKISRVNRQLFKSEITVQSYFQSSKQFNHADSDKGVNHEQ